ncbi:S8 family serine peptidase [Carboxylicivirga marina]|uniref:S8 family serine peptidase n=1 Tax=Carboxylicivirga marina TaxID=2800988 RepID=UPI0025985E20|nr:S8 family serine peptidase [uncultured Carboxylicivirga sp.]
MKSILICLVATLAAPAFSAFAQQKIVVTKAEDLPKHTYELQINDAVTFIQDEKNVLDLAALIKHDLLNDLDTYEIKDKSSLNGIYSKLRVIAVLEKDYVAALKYIQKSRVQSDKESDKLIRGLTTEALVNAFSKYDGTTSTKIGNEVSSFLDDFFKEVDFSLIQEDVEQTKGILEIYSENLVIGQVKGSTQKMLDNNKGKIPGDMAYSLIGSYFDLNFFMPYKNDVYASYATAIELYGIKTEMLDIWEERDSVLLQHNLTNVTIGVWDSGIDISVLPDNQRWNNREEIIDQKDNDQNGFIDDVNGIAYTKEGKKTSQILLPVEYDDKQMDSIKESSKGLMDLIANIQSDEAKELKKYLAALEPDDFDRFIERLGLYGLYAHGTHVAGIVVDGNPKAKVLCARLTFDHRNIPDVPTVDKAQNWAQMYKDVVTYFDDNSARVVNMSWSVDYDYEFLRPLEINGYGNDVEERKALAKKLYEIERMAFIEAVSSAPDVLFVCAAGNENNDADFAAFFPASLNYPNLITVGAVDKAGRKTSFTTEGESVDVFANGYEVASYVPGGSTIAYSGTSMASPQVANLAAKMLAVNPILSPSQLVDIIVSTATRSDEDILLIHPKNAIEKAKNTRLMEFRWEEEED